MLFSEEGSAEAVATSFAGTEDPRLREVMTSLVRHLHAFVKDVELTDEEWLEAIGFLTAYRADVRRRTPGVHPALRRARGVDAGRDDQPPGGRAGPPSPRCSGRSTWSSHRHASSATTSPWTARARRASSAAGSPAPTANRSPAPPSTPGRPTTTASTTCSSPACSAETTSAACSPPTPTAGSGSAPSCPATTRSRTTARSATCCGHRPASLPPRPSHFIVPAPGYAPVTTHVFVAGSPYLDSDAVFGVKESLVREVVDGVRDLRRRPPASRHDS